MSKLSFVTWLRFRTDRDDPVGDLARDVERDPCALYLMTAKDLWLHMKDVHGVTRDEDSAAALKSAYQEWKVTE